MLKQVREILFSIRRPSDVIDLDVDEFCRLYTESSDSVLLDVRTAEEIELDHLPGFIGLDYKQNSFLDEVKKLDKTKHYFVYCRSGRRSRNACMILKKEGVAEAFNLKGGIIAYRKVNPK